MIPNILILSNENQGSSLSLPAHGWVGARATSPLAAHFALQNTLSKSAEKKAFGSEGEAEGGCGGNSASPEPKRSPAALLVGSRTPHKSFLFLLEEKIGRAQNKKCRENFSVLLAKAKRRRAETLGGVQSAKSSGFCSKKVRISSKQYRQFTISAFWAVFASRLRRSAGALRAQRADFERVCHAPRGKKEMFWFWIRKFVLAKPKAKQSFANQSFFVPPLAERKAIIF